MRLIKHFWKWLTNQSTPQRKPIVLYAGQHIALSYDEAMRLFGKQISQRDEPPVTGISHGFTALTAKEIAAGASDCLDIHSISGAEHRRHREQMVMEAEAAGWVSHLPNKPEYDCYVCQQIRPIEVRIDMPVNPSGRRCLLLCGPCARVARLIRWDVL